LLVTIPGVDALTAAIVAEIGVDMAVFGTAQRLAAWAGLCPANHESAGKQTRRDTRKGHPYPKATLVTAAVYGARTKGTYLRDKFHRLRARLGTKKAAVAVAHKILVAAFHMLPRAVAFADLGADTSTASTSTAPPSGWSAASTCSATPSCSAPSPPWHISTPDPAHPCEFSGQPPRFATTPVAWRARHRARRIVLTAGSRERPARRADAAADQSTRAQVAAGDPAHGSARTGAQKPARDCTSAGGPAAGGESQG